METLPREFYARDTIKVARELLGQLQVRRTKGKLLTGLIIETEAYTGPGDPASHAARGPTPRSLIMFGPPGKAYVYFCYGNHYLLNVVTEREGSAGAVLIRGLVPLRGLRWMLKNRKKEMSKGLLDGPGKLTQAFQIGLALNGWNVTLGKRLFFAQGITIPRRKMERGPRIGIGYSMPPFSRHSALFAGNRALPARPSASEVPPAFSSETQCARWFGQPDQ